MEDFNYLNEALEKSIIIGGTKRRPHYHVIAKKGDITKFMPISKWDHISQTRIDVEFNSMSDRKLESQRRSCGNVLIYDPINMFIAWNTVYINSKGSYFNKHGKTYYL